ncbi:hypothetical protein HDV02_005647 [Globomyces sp. JEL0801]|nr:hypothetical protein HDV02_005647 [Globomyces sp. JEL0801]
MLMHFSFKKWPIISSTTVKFFKDFTLETDLLGDRITWNFTNGKVSVYSQEPLNSFRNPDWSWRLENSMVVYTSLKDTQLA